MRILFFAQLKDATGCSEARLPDGDEWTAEQLWGRLLEQFPALAPHRPCVRLAVNGEYANKNAIFRHDDEVALIPPVSGG